MFVRNYGLQLNQPESIEKPDKRQIKFLKDIDVRRINQKHVGDETQTFPKQIVRPFFVVLLYRRKRIGNGGELLVSELGRNVSGLLSFEKLNT